MRSLLAALVVCFAVATPLRAQEAESQAIIDKALKAQGGVEKVVGLKAFTAKLKGSLLFAEMNLDFTMEMFSQLPNKSKAIINLTLMDQKLEVVQAWIGEKGWKSLAGMVEDADNEELQEHKAMKHVESVTGLFGIKDDKALKMSPLGETKVGEVACVGVQVTKKDERDVNLYFDKKTHLLVKAEYRAFDPFSKQEVAQEKYYSDYKELVPGLKMASKQVIHNDTKKAIELEFLEMQSVDRHDDSIFAKPN